jgi:hypothetical protein
VLGLGALAALIAGKTFPSREVRRSERNACNGCTGFPRRFAKHRFGFFLLGFKTIPYFDVLEFIGTVI